MQRTRYEPQKPDDMPKTECYAIVRYQHRVNTPYEGGETVYEPCVSFVVYTEVGEWQTDVQELAIKGEKFSAFKLTPASVKVEVKVGVSMGVR